MLYALFIVFNNVNLKKIFESHNISYVRYITAFNLKEIKLILRKKFI